jgi:hypothetical protein
LVVLSICLRADPNVNNLLKPRDFIQLLSPMAPCF